MPSMPPVFHLNPHKPKPAASQYEQLPNDPRKTKRWQRLRMKYLRSVHGLCEDPFGFHKQDGRTVQATSIHHKKPVRKFPELVFVWSNLEALCESCHAKREPK